MNSKWLVFCTVVLSMTYIQGDVEHIQDNHPIMKFKDNDEHWFPKNLIDLFYYYYDHNRTASAPDTKISSVQPPLKIGAFNVQTLSDKKIQREEIMDTVVKVILRYDLILITELLLRNFSHLEKLMTTLNRLAPDRGKYKVSVSIPHPSTNESCAFIYRSDKLTVHKAETYSDPDNIFFRKPLIVHFKTSLLRDMEDFVALGLHVKPDKAVDELNELAIVYDRIKEKYSLSDVIMMGDFNADCTYVKEGDWEKISLWTRLDFTWPITHKMDTTTNYRSCALDRFVFAGKNMNDAVIMSSAGVFHFEEEYGLDRIETKKVSDHYPIEIQIRGKASQAADKHLTPGVCVTLEDSRIVNISLDKDYLRDYASAAGLKMTTNADGSTVIEASDIRDEETEILKTLQKINSIIPGLISKEQEDALSYKLRYGILRDDSSYADLYESLFYFMVLHKNQKTSILACRKTTVN